MSASIHRRSCDQLALCQGRTTACPACNSQYQQALTLHLGALHRVDASQMPAHADGAAVGHRRTDMGLCFGHPACADVQCPGHPGGDEGASAQTRATRPARPLRAWLLRLFKR